MKVELSLSLLLVIHDVLYGSLRIADRGDIWRYTKEQRESTLKVIDEMLQDAKVEVEVK